MNWYSDSVEGGEVNQVELWVSGREDTCDIEKEEMLGGKQQSRGKEAKAFRMKANSMWLVSAASICIEGGLRVRRDWRTGLEFISCLSLEISNKLLVLSDCYLI